MVAKAKFIHAADLHLGSPLKSMESSDPRIAQALRDAVWDAFDRLIAEAVAHDVDFVLIAGDVFDSPRPSYAAMMCFVDGMERLGEAQIPVFICTGNHEQADAWEGGLSGLPANVTLFALPEAEYSLVADRNGHPLVAIVGRGFAKGADAVGFQEMSARAVLDSCGGQPPFAVGMLHTGLDIDKSIVPASPADLYGSGLDYWALGHIHKRFIDSSENPRYAYPGCIQGRDSGEAGDHGCLLVCLEEGKPNSVRFLPLSPVTWERVPFDVSHANDAAHVECLLTRFLGMRAEACAGDLLIAHIVLEGESPAYDAFARDDVLEGIRSRLNAADPSFACVELASKVRPIVDRDALYDQGLFPAALLSSFDALREDRRGVAEFLQASFKERKLDRFDPHEDDVEELCHAAEGMLLSMLMGGHDA